MMRRYVYDRNTLYRTLRFISFQRAINCNTGEELRIYAEYQHICLRFIMRIFLQISIFVTEIREIEFKWKFVSVNVTISSVLSSLCIFLHIMYILCIIEFLYFICKFWIFYFLVKTIHSLVINFFWIEYLFVFLSLFFVEFKTKEFNLQYLVKYSSFNRSDKCVDYQWPIVIIIW